MVFLREKATNRMPKILSMIQMRIALILRDEEGQGLAEYALILAFIAVVAISAVLLLGSDISSLLNKVAEAL
jgi:pilus assembly protein Flp/PilA